jgi:hypothetical protein
VVSSAGHHEFTILLVEHKHRSIVFVDNFLSEFVNAIASATHATALFELGVIELASLADFCNFILFSCPFFAYLIENVVIIPAISSVSSCSSGSCIAVFNISIHFESLRRKLSKIKLFIVVRICCVWSLSFAEILIIIHLSNIDATTNSLI